MTDFAKDVSNMHAKFGVRAWMEQNKNDPVLMRKYMRFRLGMCMEEMNETITAALFDQDNAEVVDGLIDLCVFAIGTLDVFGVDVNEAWDEVHKANMAKEPGIKPERENKFGLPDLIKPKGWEQPNHEFNTGNISDAL